MNQQQSTAVSMVTLLCIAERMSLLGCVCIVLKGEDVGWGGMPEKINDER